MSMLPHRYGWPWYRWARAFYKAVDKQCFLVAANQVSKSSTQIRKFIEWGTNDALWPTLWKNPPRQFWYLYPNRDVATAEFELKWVPEFMPRGKMKESHSKCGWEAHYERGKITYVHFNSGLRIYFKTYSQNVNDLQSGTVNYIGFDEELPMELYDELMFRLSAVDGYFSGVFTATLNQPFWKNVMEGKGEDELLKDAFKLQISKFDCLTYEDGSPGAYTEEKIKREISTCKSETEVQRRIYGKFVTEEGRVYPAFEYDQHMIKPASFEIPKAWVTYVGIDIGSGGTNHPAAIVFVAVNPMNNLGIVYDGWRGDGIVTESADILNKYLELKKKNNVEPAQVFYDWHARDFYIVATRAGVPLSKPDKNHAVGEEILNTLWKNKMLLIHETEELRKLGNEFSTLMGKHKKNKSKDDFIDATRYAVVGIPWAYESVRMDAGIKTIEEKTVVTRPLTDAEYLRWIDCKRKKIPFDAVDKAETHENDSWREFEEDLDEWGENYEV